MAEKPDKEKEQVLPEVQMPQHEHEHDLHKKMDTEHFEEDKLLLTAINLQDKVIHFKHQDTIGGSGAIGLFGFGLGCFLLNIYNSGVFGVSPVILATGFAFGGLAQFISGIFEWIKNHSFTAVVFISYGMF
jgi:succinate-acetate transporter protein